MRLFIFILLFTSCFIFEAQSSSAFYEDSTVKTRRSHRLGNVITNNESDTLNYKVHYRNWMFSTPDFYFDGRTSFFSISRRVHKFEFGVGLLAFGYGTNEPLTPYFAPTLELISQAEIRLLYLDLPIYYDIGSHLKVNFGKLYIGAVPQILIAGKAQFMTQLENPIVVHDYDRYEDPDYMAFETKWNVRLAIEYRLTLFRYIELGINFMQNLRSIAPTYFQVDHSFFPKPEVPKIERFGGVGLTLGVKF